MATSNPIHRRKFFSRATAAAGATVGSGLEAADKRPRTTRTVHYKVTGFTCITCAVGLETMLRGMPGVTAVKATYPAGEVTIGFDEHAIAEATLREFIATCGFATA